MNSLQQIQFSINFNKSINLYSVYANKITINEIFYLPTI